MREIIEKWQGKSTKWVSTMASLYNYLQTWRLRTKARASLIRRWREVIPIIAERKGGLVWHVDNPTQCKIRSIAGDIDNKVALARLSEAIKPGVEKLSITKMWRNGRSRSKFPRHTILLSSGYGNGEGSDLPSKILEHLNRHWMTSQNEFTEIRKFLLLEVLY